MGVIGSIPFASTIFPDKTSERQDERHSLAPTAKRFFSQLAAAVDLSNQRELSVLEKQGLIQAFEFTHELAWNVLKDYFEYQGNTQITGSRDAAREGFRLGLLSEGATWMEMIQSRNQTTHTYNQATADAIVARAREAYFPLFLEFLRKMESLKAE